MVEIKCLLIDDEPIAIRILERHIALFDELKVCSTFNSAVSAQAYLRNNQIDLVFLDIEMPGMNGMAFLKTLKHQPAVVFTTAYREYAAEAYDMDVLDYLVKPISIERFGRAINRFHERFSNINRGGADIKKINSVVNIKTSNEIVRLSVDDIYYIESFGDYIIVYKKGGKIISRDRISHMEELLRNHQTLRIHRRYLINIEHVSALKGNMVVVNNTQLPIGRTYRTIVKECMH